MPVDCNDLEFAKAQWQAWQEKAEELERENAALKKTCECGHDPADHEPGCNEDEISCCTFLGCGCDVYEFRYKPLEKLAAIEGIANEKCWMDPPNEICENSDCAACITQKLKEALNE